MLLSLSSPRPLCFPDYVEISLDLRREFTLFSGFMIGKNYIGFDFCPLNQWLNR
jgi:hypothetical protein